MSVINQVTWKSLPIPTYNRFSATYNALGAGQYNFDANPANVGQHVTRIDPAYTYLIAAVSYSASISEGVYLKSLTNTTDERPRATLKFERGNAPVYPFPIPCINFYDDLEWQFFFLSPKGRDNLIVDFQGVLNQVSETVGVSEIFTQLSLTIYQENDSERNNRLRAGDGNTIMSELSSFASNVFQKWRRQEDAHKQNPAAPAHSYARKTPKPMIGGDVV